MSREPRITAAHVRDVILRDLDRQAGTDGQWRVDDRFLSARECRVFKAHTPLAAWPLAVKVYRSDARADLIGEQHELLGRFHAGMAKLAGLTVPAPFAPLPEHRTLIMEWIGEPRMDVLLWRAGNRREERARLMAAAGCWLRAFHDQSGIDTLGLRAQNMQIRIDSMYGEGEGAAEAIRDPLFRRAYRAAVDRVSEFKGAPMGYVMAHGDFNTHNLFHGPARTVGFDLTHQLKQPIAFDICRFLVHAESGKPFLTRKGSLAPSGIERQDLDAFMAAYGSLKKPLDGRVMVYLQLVEALRRWASLIGPNQRIPFSLVRPFRIYRLKRIAAHALNSLEGG
jgi:hypothetical protein